MYKKPAAFSDIITINSRMLAVCRSTENLALAKHPILFAGETGTGKEFFAKVIHGLFGVKGQFVVVNTAGLDDSLFSDSLFGHVKGGFTGADKARSGLVESAAGLTVFPCYCYIAFIP